MHGGSLMRPFSMRTGFMKSRIRRKSQRGTFERCSCMNLLEISKSLMRAPQTRERKTTTLSKINIGPFMNPTKVDVGIAIMKKIFARKLASNANIATSIYVLIHVLSYSIQGETINSEHQRIYHSSKYILELRLLK